MHCNAILFCVTGKQAKFIKPGNTPGKTPGVKTRLTDHAQKPDTPGQAPPGSYRDISLQFVLHGLQLNNSLMIYII